jgi:hypothetical protein
MAGLINLELFADFFNKIGPSRPSAQCTRMSEIEVTADSQAMAGLVSPKPPEATRRQGRVSRRVLNIAVAEVARELLQAMRS